MQIFIFPALKLFDMVNSLRYFGPVLWSKLTFEVRNMSQFVVLKVLF